MVPAPHLVERFARDLDSQTVSQEVAETVGGADDLAVGEARRLTRAAGGERGRQAEEGGEYFAAGENI